jgi:hypothetical protein
MSFKLFPDAFSHVIFWENEAVGNVVSPFPLRSNRSPSLLSCRAPKAIADCFNHFQSGDDPPQSALGSWNRCILLLLLLQATHTARVQGAHVQAAHVQAAHVQAGRVQAAHAQAARVQAAHVQAARVRAGHVQAAHVQAACVRAACVQAAHRGISDLHFTFSNKYSH